VVISGKYNTWSQAAVLTALPDGYNLAVSNLAAVGGQGCVLLRWSGLPLGSVKGFNVYRFVNGVATFLNQVPIASTVYADTNLVNGTNYQYQVRAVNKTGAELIGFGNASATPVSSAPTLAWRNPPTVSLSDNAGLYCSLSTGGNISWGFLLIDGRENGSLDTPNANGKYPDGTQIIFDTSVMSNGAHTVQMVGQVGGIAIASPPLTIQVANDFSHTTYHGLVETDTDDISRFNITLPVGTVNWTAQILSEDIP